MATRILHLSDLHFGAGLRESDRSFRQKWLLRGGLCPHDFQLVSALSAKLHRIALSSGKFDLTVVTGDVSTDGSVDSMTTAANFLGNAEIFSGSPGHFVVNGLGPITEALVVLPGNHDRFKGLLSAQLDFGKFESVFLKEGDGYPYVTGFMGRTFASDRTDPSADIVLFVFDSTAVNHPPFEHKPIDLIARGYIDDAACGWLEAKAEELRKKGVVKGPDGKGLTIDFDTCVKVVAVHHHPIDFLSKSEIEAEYSAHEDAVIRASTPEIADKWTSLENRERFAKACFSAGVDMVLFGHQHQYLRRELDEQMKPVFRASVDTRSIQFLCCPTTTQLSSFENGFFVYNIRSSEFEVEYFAWDEQELKFVRNSRRGGRFPFHRGRWTPLAKVQAVAR